MCKNIAKSATATEHSHSNYRYWWESSSQTAKKQIWAQQWFMWTERMQIWLLSRPSYQNRQRERKTSSFQDPISRPLCTYNEESLVVSDHELPEQTQLRKLLTEAPQQHLTTEVETPFKTLHINGIWVSGEKYNKESHFKTPTDSTRGSREQQRQKLTPFKTPVHVLDRYSVKSKQTDFFQDHG